jgi:hypothetical protein
MPPPETGRQRAARIPLDYYNHPNPLDLGRGWWALGIAALLALGGVATGWLASGHGQSYYSRGPVAAVHATWEDNCMACHTPFTPISGEAWAGSVLSDVPAMNQKCNACHAGPAHHAHQTPELACASCHHDHRGRDASLVRLSDSACTQCHANLKIHRSEGETTVANQVTAFSALSHPEFRALQGQPVDPGRLKFSHDRHMSLGMAAMKRGDPKEESDPKWTLGRIAKEDQDRYRRNRDEGDNTLIQLECSSCHRLDSGDFGIQPGRLAGLPVAALLPERAAGAYMLPITYENQCRGCHPLTFEPRGSGDVAVPHGLQLAQVREFLERHYTAEYLKENVKLFEQFVPVRPLPGKLPGEQTEKALKFIQDKVDKAERFLTSCKTTCAECHYDDKDKDRVPLERIAPTRVPDVWFKDAVFNHAAHRAVDCRACHARAYPDSKDEKGTPNASWKQADVLLPGIETCLKCHAPPSTSGKEVRGGARFDCTECHRYHNGDQPLQGIGAKARGARQPGSIEDFLSGSLKGGGVKTP